MPDNLRLLIHSAKQIVQVTDDRALRLSGSSMKTLKILVAKPQDGLSIVVDQEGYIIGIDFDSVILKKYEGYNFDAKINAEGQCILPGFVDAHTHPVWAGDRVHEFRMKLAGASYMEIHNSGGGIHFTVNRTQLATEDELYKSFRDRIFQMMRSGTTTVECKSGYGLTTEAELKLLRVIERGKKQLSCVDIITSYCGAHAIPSGKSEYETAKYIIEDQLPAIAREIRMGALSVENIDVFCEKNVFELETTRRILETGKRLGFRVNFHADEIYPLGGTELGVSMGAEAMSHLERISDIAIQGMVESGTVGIILPSTAYILSLKPPPVRKMIDSGATLALGSDFNPNAYCLSMPVIMNLACIQCNMSLEEALIASTLNAAAALGLSESHGSIEVGKKGDFVIADVPSWEHIIYQFGEHRSLIQVVVKNGFPVFRNL